MTADRMIEHRADQLASLPALGIALPEPVSRAFASYQAAMRLPVPPRPEPRAVEQAVAGRAAELVAETPPGKLAELAADVTAIGAARQAAQDAEDRAALAAAVKGAAAERLCQVMTGEIAQQVIDAIQAKYGAAVSDLATRAARLPPGITTEGALTAGGRVRDDLLKARDRIAELRVLRQAVAQVEGPHALAGARSDGLGACVRFEQTGRLYRDHWQAGNGITTAGPLDSEAMWLALAPLRELRWWAPTTAEATARAAELEAQFRAERVRAAMAG
jgi:hypothetical protein